MAKTATLSMRIDPDVKSQAEELYGEFGMSLSDAVTVFLHKSLMEGGLPFEVRRPRYNKATEEAMREARQIMASELEAETYGTVDELFASLDEGDE